MMRTPHRAVPWAVLLSAFGGVGGIQAQHPASCESLSSWCGLSAAQAEFLLASRRAIQSYQSSTVAVADGFRPVGADAPAMGRHWISLTRLFDGEIDPARPEILMYAIKGGRETLVGIGFAYVVGSGEGNAPPQNPFEPDAWHVHSGRLDMESHRTDHEGAGVHGPEPVGHGQSETGISVLHAWVQVENPAGVIEPNNWALPYFRMGLSRPQGATPEADRAVALASQGAGFFIDRAKLFADQGAIPAAAREKALRGAEVDVMEWWRTRPTGPLAQNEVDWLSRVWRRLGLKGL